MSVTPLRLHRSMRVNAVHWRTNVYNALARFGNSDGPSAFTHEPRLDLVRLRSY